MLTKNLIAMRKSLMTLTLLLLAFTTFAGTFALGIKGGINTSKLSTNLNALTADMQGGYNFGAFGRFGGKHFYLNPEFLYVVNNSKITSGGVTDAVKTKSIQVPVLLGLNLLNLKVIRLNAFTGPAVSFGTGYESDKSWTYNMNKASWDYMLGAGIDLLMFTLDVRYSWGLSTKDFTPNNPSSSFTSKVNAFRISLGFKIL
jgi:hypothetical protein